MSVSVLPEDSLVDLLLQLKKTTPEQARAVLNSQPQVSYALMDLMVKINAVNMDVFQRILAAYGAAQATASAAPPPIVQPQPQLAVPPHPQQPNYPSTSYPAPYSNGYPPPPPNPSQSQPPSYSGGGNPLIPAHLENLPDDQKAMIAQVLSMTAEQINALPLTERSGIIQLRATLGFPV